MARRPGEGSNSGPGGGTTSRPKRKAPSRPLVLAPGAGYDAKRGRATSPPRPRVFDPGLPKPGSGIRRAARDVGRREGEQLAKLPGVKSRLTPTRGPSTPEQREAVIRRAATLTALAGLTPAQRSALGLTRTQAGAALRQAQRAQNVGIRRALTVEGARRVVPGVGDLSPEALKHVSLRGLDPGTRRMLMRAGMAGAVNPRAKAGAPDKRIGIGPASVNTTALARTVLAATSLDGGDIGPRNFFKGGANDVLALGTGPFIGGLQAYRALAKLAQGKPDEAGQIAGETAKAIGQGFVDSVPGYLVRGRFNDALDYGMKHPVFSVLDLAAGAGIVGRGAGAFARGAGSNAAAGGARGAMARFGSTVRSPIALTSDAGAIRNGAYRSRTFSMDSIRKGVQVAQDRGREVVRDQHGKPVLVKERGRMVPVLKPTEREMAKHQRSRANHRASKGNSLERLVRAEAGQELDRAARGGSRVGRKVLKGKDARDLVHLVVTGTVRGTETFREDLLRRADTIDKALEAGKHRHSGDRKIAEAQSAWLRGIADNPKVLAQADRIVEAAHGVAAKLNAGDRTLEDARILDAAQGRRARLSEYALAHMDARNVTVREHQALEKSAREAERAAHETLDAVRRGEPTAVPANEVRWFHGTRRGGFAKPSAEHDGTMADLGLYLTAEPTYAAKYAGEEVGGKGGKPVLHEISVDSQRTLETRFGKADPAELVRVGDALAAVARRLDEAYLDGKAAKPPTGALRVLDEFRTEIAAARSVKEWKAAEAKLYDAAMKIAAVDGSKAFSTAPLRKVLRELGYDAVRKVDDGADTLVALTDSILKHRGVHGADKAPGIARARVDEARRAYRAAHQQRLRVSGRDPQGVVAHEKLVAQERVAKERAARAGSEVESLKSRLDKMRARHQSQRMADKRAVADGRMDAKTALRRDAERGSAKLRDGEIGGLMAQLDRATKKARGAEKTLAEARRARQGSKLPPTQEAIRGPGGEFLSNRAIEQHARAAGRDPETLAYVPHTVGGVGRRAYHQPLRPGTRPRTGSQRRTGEMFRSGVASVGDQVVRDTLVAKRTLVTKAETLDHYIHESGVRLDEAAIRELRRGSAHGPLTRAEKRVLQRGGYMTAGEATELAERMAADGRGNLVPVRAFSAGLDEASQAALRDRQNPAAMESAHLGLFNSRLLPAEGEAGKARNVVLVPADELNQMLKHARPAGELEKVGNLLNTPFRLAVLPQPRWMTGNFIEPFFVRLPLVGAGINLPGLAMDVHAAVKTLRHMERSGNPEWERAAKEIRAELLGGTFIGRRGASNRRTYEDFAEEWGSRSGAAGGMYAAHVIRTAPFVKQGIDIAMSLAHGFFAFNRVMEREMQRQDLGKSIRADVREFSGSFAESIRLGKESLDEIANGLVGTATQQRYAEKQYETLGKYFGFGPKLRRFIQTVFPFLPWSLNAARFVFWTMPVHHTIVTAGLLKLSQNLQADWDAQHKDLPPGSLKLALPTADGGWVDLARYTPYGFSGPIVAGDLKGVTAPFFPQLSGLQSALDGKDPFGKDLRVAPTADNPEGIPSGLDKILIGLNSGAEALTPYMALIRRLREAGGTPYGNSTILSPKTKPGTDHGSGVNRALNPFRPIYVSAQAPGKAGSVKLSKEQKALLREAQHVAGKTSPAQAERERQALLREAAFAARGR